RWLDGRDDQLADSPGGELELTARPGDGNVELEMTHTGPDPDVDVDALLEIVVSVLSEIAADPRRRADSIPLVSPSRHRWLVDDLHTARIEYPSAATVGALVRQVAAEAPDEVAVVDGDRDVTYVELVERAEGVADMLRAAGAPPGAAIGVMFARGLACITAMLGALFAGGVYVPIPIEDPDTRQEQLLDLAGVGWLLRGDARQQ